MNINTDNSNPLTPQAQALLDQLNPIHAPEQVGLWPLALGWWLLIIAIGSSLAWLAWHLYRARRNGRYRRQAVAALQSLKAETSNTLATDVSIILKRAALSAYPNERRAIANTFGPDWVRLLNRTCGKTVFAEDMALALSQGPYRPNIEFDPNQLIKQAIYWVRHHPSTLSSSRQHEARNV